MSINIWTTRQINQSQSIKMNKQSVEKQCTELFEEYNPNKMNQFLTTASEQLKKVSRNAIHILICGGMGNGINSREWEITYDF